MGVLEQITQMKSQNIPDQEIVSNLQEQGVSPREINDVLKKKEGILPKKIHCIKLTYQDLLENLKKKDKVVIDVVKNAVVLYGQDKYVEILKNVTSF